MKKTFRTDRGRFGRRLFAVILLLAASCSPHSLIPPPEVDNSGTDVDQKEGEVSIAYLKTLWKGAPVKITRELRISGNVVSSDVAGNFYKTLVLDDGTGGIELKLDMERLHRRFIIHSVVDVRCNGLWLGSYGGTLQLGADPYDQWQTQYIAHGDVSLHCFPAGVEDHEILPRTLTFAGLEARHISTFVSFEGVQFIDEEMGMCWAEVDADTDTDRRLVDTRGDTLTVRTSRHAAFAHKTLPEGNGYIEGVLNFFNGRYQLVLCDDQKAVMRSERWTPST